MPVCVHKNRVMTLKDHFDVDITWWIQSEVKSSFDHNSQALKLREKAACCGSLGRIIYSTIKQDWVGSGQVQENHEAYCGDCAKVIAPSLRHLLAAESLAQQVFYFGKHKGKKMSEVPRDYLEWCALVVSDQKLKAKISAYLNVNTGSIVPDITGLKKL